MFVQNQSWQIIVVT
jgi:beta-galactosidase/beta-glucuronidase